MSRLTSAALCAALLAAGAATAAPPDAPKAVYLELQPLDAEVSPAVNQQLSEALAKELEKALSLTPRAEVDAVRAGTEKEPDTAAATALLAEAKTLLGNVQARQAFKKLAAARAILEPLRPQLRDYTQFTQVLLYTAVVAMNLGDKRTAAAAFADLARLRPDFRIDSAEFPPNVVEAFDKARQAEAKQPRGRLLVSSVPAGAQVFVDEVARGQTPLTVPASPGEHVVRLSSPSYLSWTKTVAVESYGKHEVKAELAKNVPQASLKQLEEGAVAGEKPQVLLDAAQVVSTTLGAQAVVVGISALSVKGYVVTAAWLPKDGTPQVMAVDINRSLDNLRPQLEALGAAVAAAPLNKPVIQDGALAVVPVGSGKLSRAPDFGKYGLGYAPGGAAAVLAEAAKAPVGVAPSAVAVTKPGVPAWVWVGIGVLAVGAAAGGTAIYFATRPPAGVQFVLQRQQ